VTAAQEKAEELAWDTFIDYALEAGWTDGLPVVPPTRQRVDAMLARLPATAGSSLGKVPPLLGELTMERLAANAVMAGCLPEYFPVVVAGMRALLEPSFNLAAAGPTTNPVGSMLLVSGPVRAEVGLNCGSGCLGPGTRANATIGRAVRLAIVNVGGAAPGKIDKATQGFPGKFTMCFGENEEESPWLPFHVRHGFAPQDSIVTAYQACGTLNIQDQPSAKGTELVETIAGAMRVLGSNNLLSGNGPAFLVLCPKHARILASDFTIEQLQETLLRRTAMRISDMPAAYRAYVQRRRETTESDEFVTITKTPADIEILVAGGPGNHSVFIPGYGNGQAPSVPVLALLASKQC
jgi:hypothetical protein